MAEKTTQVAPREREHPARRDPSALTNPFPILERFADEVDRIFNDVRLGRSWVTPRWAQDWLAVPQFAGGEMWAPQVEVFQQNQEVVIRADLPGMTKDDISVDVTDDRITISGERRQEQEVDRGGTYRSERSYGTFRRTIPLPQGAISDQAKATFKDGVLEVTVPAPPEQVTRGRHLEIKAEADARK